MSQRATCRECGKPLGATRPVCHDCGGEERRVSRKDRLRNAEGWKLILGVTWEQIEDAHNYE